MDLESKYCYFYHSWDFVPYYSTIKQMKNWCENNNEKWFLNDYIQTIDHFYKDAKWQQNQSYIIHESCSANQQNVTLHVKYDHQYRRNFKSLNIIWCTVFFSAFVEMHDFFFSRNTSSVLHVEYKAVWDCWRFTPSLHHV